LPICLYDADTDILVPRRRYGFDTKGSEHLAELHTLLRRTVMVRRTLDDAAVLADMAAGLPKLDRHQVPVHLSSDERKRHEALMSQYDKQRGGKRNDMTESDFTDGNGNMAGVLYNRMYQNLGLDKLPHVIKILKKELRHQRKSHTTRKFLVFAHHKVVVSGIARFLAGEGVEHRVIEGATSSKQRDKARLDFQSPCGHVQAMVLSIIAANAGVTLTAASLCFFAELCPVPSLLKQCECRIHRIGQTQPCEVRYLVASGRTIDREIWQMLQRKLFVVGTALDGARDTALGEQGAAAVASFLAAVLTEIYLCNVCSCPEILRRSGRGQSARVCRSRPAAAA
jgi:SWI/SNF-related matrix-associated actin-dependent regulator 1 of chromatin subfamily A